MSQPSDRPAPRFGPRVRTYEQQITAEFEQEIAELNGKLYERDMEIGRLREETESWEVLAEHQIWCRQCYEGGTENCEIAGPLLQEARRLRGMRAASRDEERDHHG